MKINRDTLARELVKIAGEPGLTERDIDGIVRPPRMNGGSPEEPLSILPGHITYVSSADPLANLPTFPRRAMRP